ncbi:MULTISPECIES: LysR family transcriptional regulator [unclassified Herbaspirillum]|uniref:LysR family transcriptional regulator n=1 Tax=unclassified Herbaspirillum TaxID=2624150 RepID=UPI00114F0186|nr:MULTISPECIES: LysR family transcriptional regulator [unclassified Herbaspirillum]MBB5391431.1 DNA-binding transcriptional LysR family regulator [Herbaspirillum sp. SJZ102]TQK12884.1 DNA-binding transcriptional LysR family regulator [Herbaspirillum sp. SJZ130]TQK14888.1 DNA-binding transcriptional LysR family regulator [Herbaspirillum sp. SJZ106]TWC67243.1 DNA-binding transcriptional LysR family regulator [Herbaspirillum sp. SJZ099]
MNLTLESLLILDMIDRKGSFAAAALALDRVPSALTYSVRKLEDDLDVLLFDRRGHRAQLTPAGQQLLQEGRHLLLAANDLEQRVKRTATGRETELHIVLNSLIPFGKMRPIIEAFDREQSGTRLRFTPGVLTGAWEKLIEGRANLVIGVTLDGPEIVRTSGRFQMHELGMVDWVFAVAPHHPLAHAAEPLPAELVRSHRAVAVGDNSQSLPTLTMGLLSGQETLTVATVADKLEAQLAGLGCGHLPRIWAAPYLASGALVEKQTLAAKPNDNFMIAWPKAEQGKSLKWFIQHLSQPEVQRSLLGPVAPGRNA